jgi:hypothetical protein
VINYRFGMLIAGIIKVLTCGHLRTSPFQGSGLMAE